MKPKHILIGIFAIAVISFGYYAISPLFRNIRVDEAIPAAPEAASPAETERADSTAAESVAATNPAPVEGTPGHPASGQARIVRSGGKTYLRYENFKTINGPDIYVYLSKDLDAKEFVSLGPVRATEGNINYEIPEGVDPREYPYALTWCKAFSVLFNSAKVY